MLYFHDPDISPRTLDLRDPHSDASFNLDPEAPCLPHSSSGPAGASKTRELIFGELQPSARTHSLPV